MKRDSAGLAAPRALFLLAAAVILGVVLLQKFDKGTDPFGQTVRAQSSASERTTTTKARRTTRGTTTTVPLLTTTPARAPSEIKVLALNGTNISGVAAKASDQLRRAGYNTLSPFNTPKPVDASSVQFTPGQDADARGVAALLGLPETAVVPLTTPPPVTDIRGADVVVVVGPDLAARLGPAQTSPSTTRRTVSTTVRPITTSTTVRATTSTSFG